MNLSMHVALVNEVSNGSGKRRISFTSETHTGSIGNHSTGVVRSFGSHLRTKGCLMNRLSEGEAAEKALRNSVFFQGGIR